MTKSEALNMAIQLSDAVQPLTKRFTKELQQLERELGVNLSVKSFRRPTPNSFSKVVVVIGFEPEQ